MTGPLSIAAGGLPVFPCAAGKRPLVQHGFKDATTDPAIIAGWAARWPACLWAIPTGWVSGRLVVDLDKKNGRDGIAAFDRLCAGRNLPPHSIIETRSGGRHLHFRMPAGRDIRCSAGKLGDGIDVRGNGGYVIVPPSAGYRCVRRAAPPEPPPGWLIEMLDPPARPKLEHGPGEAPDSPSYIQAALRNAYRRVAASVPGSRNDQLNRETYALGRFVAAGSVGLDIVAREMAAAGMAAGLTDCEIEATVASALRARLAGGGAHAA